MRDDDRSGLVAGFIDGALDARTHAEVEERIARDASWACEHTRQLVARDLLLDLATDTPPALPQAARARLSAALRAHARAHQGPSEDGPCAVVTRLDAFRTGGHQGAAQANFSNVEIKIKSDT